MNNKLFWVVVVVLILGLVIGGLVIIIKSQHEQPEALRGKTPGTPTKPTTLPTPSEKEKALLVLEDSYKKGISWLMQQQLVARGDPEATSSDLPDGRQARLRREDGSWPDIEGKSDVAFTALALISIGGATTKHHAQYQTQIDKGIKYLLNHQQENGSFLNPGKIPSLVTYKTPLAILALASLDKEKYQAPILKARDYLEGIQSKDPEEKGLFGGWSETGQDLTPKPGLTITNFAMDALRQAGLPEDSETWKRAVVFLQHCQDSSEYNDFRVTGNSGGFVHSPVESKAGEETLPDGTKVLKPYGSMTHAGLMSFLYAFVDKNDPRVRATYSWLKRHYTLDENPGLRTDIKPESGQQGLYYYYYTFAKALDAYGESTIDSLPNKSKHVWAEELVKKLAALQQTDGSWLNKEPRWWEDDPRVVTPYCLISLNICRKWIK